MANQLYAISLPTVAIIIAGVVGLFLVLYGFIRKFSRMGWWGYQIVILFALTLLLNKLPLGSLASPILRFAVVAGGLLGAMAIIMGLGGLIRAGIRRRRANRKKMEGAFVVRLFDGLLGVITGAVNLAVLVAALAGPILLIISYTGKLAGVIAVFEGINVGGVNLWAAAIEPFVVDFMLIGVLVLFAKGGYRLGLLRSVWTMFMLVLGIGAFAGAIVASIMIPGVNQLPVAIAGSLAARGIGGALAAFLGYAIVTVCIFIVFLLVLVLINLLVNLGVREVDKVVFLRVIDGAIVALVFFVLGLAIVCGLNFVVFQATSGAFGEMVGAIASKLPFEQFIRSSTLSRYFYDNNLILAFFG